MAEPPPGVPTLCGIGMCTETVDKPAMCPKYHRWSAFGSLKWGLGGGQVGQKNSALC